MALIMQTVMDVQYRVGQARDSERKEGGEVRIRLKVDKHAGEP